MVFTSCIFQILVVGIGGVLEARRSIGQSIGLKRLQLLRFAQTRSHEFILLVDTILVLLTATQLFLRKNYNLSLLVVKNNFN